MKRVQLLIDGHPVTVVFDENSIHIFNAFPIKDRLKARGYRWNALEKSWDFYDGDAEVELARLRGGDAVTDAVPAVAEPTVEGLPESLTVAQLRERIDSILRSSLPATFWIRGVVASEPKAYRWATYFDLRDEDETLDMVFSCEMRQAERQQIEQRLSVTGVATSLEKDLPVFLQVEAGLSHKYTINVRLRALDILPEFTRERLRSQRDLTVERLRREGLLELQKGLRLPMLIRRVGLLTSAMGTSVRDVLAGLSPMENRYQIGFLDTRMEGNGAIDGLIAALDFMESNPAWHAQAVVIARGGGSEQSLGVFNDYRLCARICRCRIPVITAIGHEKDLSAAEICSHFTPTPSTPSGAGRFLRERFLDLQGRLGESVRSLVERFSEVHRLETERVSARARLLPRQGSKQLQWEGLAIQNRLQDFLRISIRMSRENAYRLKELNRSLQLRIRTRILRERDSLQRAVARVDFRRLEHLQDNAIVRVLDLAKGAESGTERFISKATDNVQARANLAQANHPDRILEKGFTMTYGPDGRVVPTARAFRALPWARLHFSDGTERVERKEE
ncbi:MAG: exodeoxyribonuclease VII large subunit [Candidatus Aminicenantes bacterium]|nr:exodeoxyribonuclease VII large subunit [Candidatus Aminicenantes bacterium]